MATDAAALGCLRFVPNEPPERARLGPLRLLLPPIGGVCRAVARTSGLALSGRFRLTADTLARHPVAAAAERWGCFARGLRSASRDSWDPSGPITPLLFAGSKRWHDRSFRFSLQRPARLA